MNSPKLITPVVSLLQQTNLSTTSAQTLQLTLIGFLTFSPPLPRPQRLDVVARTTCTHIQSPQGAVLGEAPRAAQAQAAGCWSRCHGLRQLGGK